MKLYCLCLLTFCFAKCTDGLKNITTVKLSDKSAYFGIVNSKDTLKYNFIVQNTGREPLIIDTVTTTYGCVKANWTKETIGMNYYGYIRVAFVPNSDESGNITKTIMLTTNTKEVFIPLKLTYNIKNKK